MILPTTIFINLGHKTIISKLQGIAIQTMYLTLSFETRVSHC